MSTLDPDAAPVAEADEPSVPGDAEGPSEVPGPPDAMDGAVPDEPAPEPADEGPGPGDALEDDELVRRVCALLFASPDPLSERRLVSLLERPRPERVRAALEALGERLAEAGLPLELRAIAGGWRLFTEPGLAEVVAGLARHKGPERISPAGLETLAIVAYRQPVTGAEVEAIRGVQAGPVLRGLVDRGLVRVTGRADQPGSPLQYGTTRAFLDRFGLASLKDLPRDAELAGD